MNSKKTYIILLVVLAAVIIGAAVGYKAFTGADRKGQSAEQSSKAVLGSQEEEADAAAEEPQAGETVPVEGASEVSEPEDAAPAPETESGEEYPDAVDFTVKTAEGISASLSDFAGKPVIVNFWATWCPPCKAELPYFQEAYEKYGSQIQFMMVNLIDGSRETDTTVQNFIKETGYTFPLFYDRDGFASMAYEIYSIPVTLGITAEGKLKYQKIGSLPQADLEEIVAGLTE